LCAPLARREAKCLAKTVAKVGLGGESAQDGDAGQGLGPIPIEVSVLYRCLLAALALFALLTVSGCVPRLPWAGQRYTALLGALPFSTNFLCFYHFYHVTLYIPSGMSAVIFASATIFNGLNLWLYEGFVWQRVSVMGVVFSLLGNLVIFTRPCGSGADGQPRR
jgi:drug/metabolite transporter (DMT)-like permease